jgi:hypothetical protein
MSRLQSKTVNLILIGVLIAIPLWGCTRRSAHQSGDEPNELSLKMAPDPARIGSAQVQISLEGAQGQAITGARLVLRGDMTHAGMQPVLAEAEEVEPGVYMATMEWPMAGDWVLTVDGILADGTSFSRQLDFRVSDE